VHQPTTWENAAAIADRVSSAGRTGGPTAPPQRNGPSGPVPMDLGTVQGTGGAGRFDRS
jgi:hypothetical protein